MLNGGWRNNGTLNSGGICALKRTELFQKQPRFRRHNRVLVVARKLAISVAFGDKATSAELIKSRTVNVYLFPAKLGLLIQPQVVLKSLLVDSH